MTREGADPSSAHGETPARVDLALEHREMPARVDAASEHRETPVVPYAVTIVAHHVGSVGGMERIITELALGLRRRGHAVTVIAYACELPADAGVTFHRVRGPSRPFVLSYPWFMLFGTLAVRRWRRGVVQATGAIVLNRVDFIEIQYCQQVGPATPSRSSLPFRLNAKVAGLLGRVAERVCFRVNRAWRFVCASEGTAEEIRRYFPQLAERVVTVQNGVDIDAFAPDSRGADARALRAQLQLDGGRLVAIFVGSEWDRKGLAPVIQSLALARDWDLLVVGNGDRERYRQLARDADVERAVHWFGVSRDVAPLYQLADAFVFPSSYEAFPLVALEAAASGLPILATPVNGVRELVREGENGFLISREPGAIAECLNQLAADPQLRERLGAAARRSALEYSWEKMVTRHDELFASRARDGAGVRGDAGAA
jgi:UDP-glucose:(heptosyl)LPS alpha-1,3-glucosyltransferase